MIGLKLDMYIVFLPFSVKLWFRKHIIITANKKWHKPIFKTILNEIYGCFIDESLLIRSKSIFFMDK